MRTYPGLYRQKRGSAGWCDLGYGSSERNNGKSERLRALEIFWSNCSNSLSNLRRSASPIRIRFGLGLGSASFHKTCRCLPVPQISNKRSVLDSLLSLNRTHWSSFSSPRATRKFSVLETQLRSSNPPLEKTYSTSFVRSTTSYFYSIFWWYRYIDSRHIQSNIDSSPYRNVPKFQILTKFYANILHFVIRDFYICNAV